MNKKASLISKLIAPCGINCGTCVAYLRKMNKCPGCRFLQEEESDYRKNCIIVHCDIRQKKKLKHCSSSCENFPCKRLKNLDKRYRNGYDMSLLENLENIEALGIRRYMALEKEKWTCPDCKEGIICVHKGYCLSCESLK